jgi:hypothetical protein
MILAMILIKLTNISYESIYITLTKLIDLVVRLEIFKITLFPFFLNNILNIHHQQLINMSSPIIKYLTNSIKTLIIISFFYCFSFSSSLSLSLK